MFALDTNTLIYYFRDQGDVARHLRSVSPQEIAIPALVLYELEVGALGSGSGIRRRRVLSGLMTLSKVLPFDQRAANAAAEVEGRLQARGTVIGPIDVLIAGTAIASNATLVTHHTAEFRRVPGLRIVDWY